MSTDLDTNVTTNDSESSVSDHTEVGVSQPSQSPEQSSKLLMEMASDPQIAQILAARREGLEIEINTVDNLPPKEKALGDQVDLGNMDDDVRKVVEILEEKIKSSLGPLTDKIKALENIAQQYENNVVASTIKDVSKRHKDFDKYRKQMAELARNEGAGLGVEELLLLSKHRAGDLSLTDPSTESERPTPTPRRITGQEQSDSNEKSQGGPSGRRQFQVKLADALDNLDFRLRE